MKIYWYEKDARFEPGTISDIGNSIRLTLSMHGPHTYYLYLQVRINKEDGFPDALRCAVKVARFKDCGGLKDAQERAEKWLEKFVKSIIRNTV